MTTLWVGMFTLSMQQKAPRLVLQITYTLPAGTLDICSNSSIICQGGSFSWHILPTYIVVRRSVVYLMLAAPSDSPPYTTILDIRHRS